MPYLDSNGEPITESSSGSAKGHYLDDNGNIISGLPVNSPAQSAFEKQYRAEQAKSGTAKAISALAAPAKLGGNLLVGLYDLIKGGVGGAADIEKQAAAETMLAQLQGKNIVPGNNMLSSGIETILRSVPNFAQTALEVVPQIYQQGKPLGAQIAANPLQAAGIVNPLGEAVRQAFIGSRTPSQEEINNAFQSQQAVNAINQASQGALAPELFGKANIPLAQAVPLAFGIEGAIKGGTNLAKGAVSKVGAIGEKIASRGIISKPLEDVITKTTGITASEGSLDTAQVAKTRIQALGETPKNSTETINAATKAQDVALQEALTPLKEARDSGLVMKGDSILQTGTDAILKDFPSLKADPKAVSQALNEFDYLKGDIAPTEAQGFLRELNRRYNGLENKNSPQASAYRAVRAELSNQVDELIKAQTGLDISPYRDWGQLEQFKNGIQDQITSAQRSQGGKSVPGFATGHGLPTTVVGGIAKAVKSLPIARAFIPRAIEAIDNGAIRILKDVEALPEPSALDQATVDAFKLKYQPSASVPIEVSPPLTKAVSPAVQADLDALRRSKFYKDAKPLDKVALEKQIISNNYSRKK